MVIYAVARIHSRDFRKYAAECDDARGPRTLCTGSYDGPRETEPLVGRSGVEPAVTRDRDPVGRPRQARPRDALGRPLPYGAAGVEPVSEEPLPPMESLRLARSLVKEGRPFAAHEVMEARWKAGPAEERNLWQGLAQLCVGLTHAARGNNVGANRLIDRGAGLVAAYGAGGGPTYGLDLAAVVAWVRGEAAKGHEG